MNCFPFSKINGYLCSVLFFNLSYNYCCSVAKSCLTLCNPMDCSTLGFSPSPRVCTSSWPLHRGCRSTISSSVSLFSFCLQSFPASGSFPVSWLFTPGDKSTHAHACVCTRECTPCVHSVLSNYFQPLGPQPTRLLCPWDFPGKNTVVGCHFFLQGIFLTPGIKPTSPALAGKFFM